MLVGHAGREEWFRPFVVTAGLRDGHPGDRDGELALARPGHERFTHGLAQRVRSLRRNDR
jgi:hypothetical protein